MALHTHTQCLCTLGTPCHDSNCPPKAAQNGSKWKKLHSPSACWHLLWTSAWKYHKCSSGLSQFKFKSYLIILDIAHLPVDQRSKSCRSWAHRSPQCSALPGIHNQSRVHHSHHMTYPWDLALGTRTAHNNCFMSVYLFRKFSQLFLCFFWTLQKRKLWTSGYVLPGLELLASCNQLD